MPVPKNVLGDDLISCGKEPITGFFRNGYCDTCDEDLGVHSICCVVTDEFLKFSKSAGNDLSTPSPQFGFPGLQAGDRWCVCAARWKEAYQAGFACPIVIEATHEKTLEIIDLEVLKKFAIK